MEEQTVARELHVELIPGTEIMRDVGDVHFVHGPKSGAVYVIAPSTIAIELSGSLPIVSYHEHCI